MTRSKRPRKISSPLTAARNLVRGAKDPSAAIARALPHVPLRRRIEFFTWAEGVSFRNKLALGPAFPQTLSLLLSYPSAEPGAFDQELSVLITRVLMYRDQLERFVKIQGELAEQFSDANYAGCERLLQQVQKEFGYSSWLLEMKLAMISLQYGLEAQKKLVEEVREECGRSVTSTIAYYTSQRNEPSTSANRYVDRIVGLLERSTLNPKTNAYYRYHLCRIVPEKAEDVQGLLLMEATSSLIDAYEALVAAVLQAAQVAIPNEPSVFRDYVPMLGEIDPRVRKLKFIESGHGEDALLTRDLTLDDLHLRSAQGDSGSIRIDSKDYRSIWLGAMSGVAQLTPASCVSSLVDEWKREVTNGISKIERTEEVLNYFTKVSYNTRVSTLSSLVELLIDFTNGNAPFQSRHYFAASLCSPFLDPWDLPFVPTSSRDSYEKALERRYGNALPVRFARWLSDVDTTIPTDLAPRWQAFGEAFKAFRNKQYIKVEQVSAHLVSDPLLHIPGVRWHCNSLIERSQSRAAIAYAAGLLAKTSFYSSVLPIGRLIGSKKWKELKGFANEIGLSVLLDFHWRQTGHSETNSFRRYAAEDFLATLGLDKPSQLATRKSDFDNSTLVYFLSNVCAPEVLDLMMAFPSSRSVLEEQREIYAILAEMDSENAPAHREGIASISRTLLLDEGVRVLDRSRLFVDKEGVVRWAEREVKESFDRYKSLLHAGVGFDAEAFAVALRRFISKQEAIPEELLSLTKAEADELMLTIVSDLRDNFLLSPTHGLDAFLSMRVRHGTLSGMLRGPLEKNHIINQRRSGTTKYERNTHWGQVLTLAPPEHINGIYTAIEEFSEGFDAAIDALRTRLQIRRKEQPTGLFDITLTTMHVLLLRTEITADTRLPEFVHAAVAIFWILLDKSLSNIRTYIERDFRSQVGRLFETLESQLSLAGSGVRYWQLNDAVHGAITQVQSVMDNVRSWFQRESGPQLSYTINHAIDVALEVVRVTYRNFEPRIEKRISSDETIIVSSVTVISDILFTTLDNVYHRSGIGKGGLVTIEVRHVGKNLLSIAVQNEVAADYDYAAGRRRLDEIQEKMRVAAFRTPLVSGEGGTGLLKLKGLVDPDDEREDAVTFGFTDAGQFRVEITMRTVEV